MGANVFTGRTLMGHCTDERRNCFLYPKCYKEEEATLQLRIPTELSRDVGNRSHGDNCKEGCDHIMQYAGYSLFGRGHAAAYYNHSRNA